MLSRGNSMKIYGSFGERQICTATLGSVTLAMKARRALAAQGLGCEVIKISDQSSSRGCVYGIEYPCEISGSVQRVLSASAIQTR
jgi:hypothetical protein